jgi:hypothetical protein
LANSRPNLRPHCQIVSCVTEMPRARQQRLVLGDLADVERDLIRTRTAEGRSGAKAQGKAMGRPPSPDTRPTERGNQTTRAGRYAPRQAKQFARTGAARLVHDAAAGADVPRDLEQVVRPARGHDRGYHGGVRQIGHGVAHKKTSLVLMSAVIGVRAARACAPVR